MKSISIGPQFCYCLKDVPVKDILASVENGLQGIFPSGADLISRKVVSNMGNNERSRSVLTRKEHIALQPSKKNQSTIITKDDEGNITTVSILI